MIVLWIALAIFAALAVRPLAHLLRDCTKPLPPHRRSGFAKGRGH